MEDIERRQVDLGSVIENSDHIIINLTDFTEADLKSLSLLARAIPREAQGIICIPMFEDEKESCEQRVWATVEVLVGRGSFLSCDASDHGELLEHIGQEGKTAYIVVKSQKARDTIYRAKPKGVKVIYCDLDADGSLYWSKVDFKKEPREARHGKDGERKPSSHKKISDYRITKKPSIDNIKPLTSSVDMGIGATVYDNSGNTYILQGKVSKNNGAYTFYTDKEGIWAKIYNAENNSSFYEDKVKRMLKDPIDHKGIMWPKDYLVDADGVFRGYLLDGYEGYSLVTGVLKREGLTHYFSSFDKYSICTLTMTILENIEVLHEKGVLFGCINPAAIRVVDAETVYFCDTDEYQIEGYPSLSYNNSFAAPENVDKDFYLASMDNERFSVAILVFMLLMTGKHPYLYGNVNVIKAIKQMHFPFFINDYDKRNPNAKVMPSMWRYMWSHLSDDLKKAFCKTFQKGMYNNEQGRRIPVHGWYELVSNYRDEISKSEDTEARELFPATFKRHDGQRFIRCSICGKYHPDFFFDQRYINTYRVCNECMEKPSDVSYCCVDCGRTFIYKNSTAIFHKYMKQTQEEWHDQRHCPECKAKMEVCNKCGNEVPLYQIKYDKKKYGYCRDCRETTFETRTCVNCGQAFDITYGEMLFYEERHYDLPRKCDSCRGRR